MMDVIENIKNFSLAVLTSGGGRLSEEQFLYDYRDLVGEDIPFRKLGYNSVTSLLLSIGGFYVYKRGRHNIINAGFDKKTHHITRLVQRQKKKPGKIRKRDARPPPRQPSFPPRRKYVPPHHIAPKNITNFVDRKEELDEDHHVTYVDIQWLPVKIKYGPQKTYVPLETRTPLTQKRNIFLEYPKTQDVILTAFSGNEIYIRLIGDNYEMKYNEVMNDLELQMMTCYSPVYYPELNEFYAVNLDNCWVRVQLKEVKGEEYLVYLIDYGDYETVNKRQLKVLDRNFLELPPQAIKCRLAYCGDLLSEEVQYLLTNMIGRRCKAQVLEFYDVPTLILNVYVGNKIININSKIWETTHQLLTFC